MRVLVACEFSGVVREAFRAKGHDAMSCDLLDTEQPGPHWMGDVFKLSLNVFDLMVAHPPCTYLTVANNSAMANGCSKYTAAEGRKLREEAIDFFMELADAPVARIAIENPIGIMSSRWRRPDQIIQPWQFGHPEAKKTCLWLKGLPKLVPTNVLPLPACGYWSNQTPSGQNKLGPSPTRAHERSRTYTGIAAAMADQWGS